VGINGLHQDFDVGFLPPSAESNRQCGRILLSLSVQPGNVLQSLKVPGLPFTRSQAAINVNHHQLQSTRQPIPSDFQPPTSNL
jgi:hypothetical protein